MVRSCFREKKFGSSKTVMELSVEGKRGRGRPKKKWLNGFECDMRTANVCVNDAVNQVKWRLRTRVADPKKLRE